MKRSCWLAQFSDKPCDGRLRKCHLIPKQLIKREVGEFARWDPRVLVWGCGGVTGCGGHHGMLDHSRRIRIPRDRLPPAVEDFAEQHDLGWWLDREYGPRAEAA